MLQRVSLIKVSLFKNFIHVYVNQDFEGINGTKTIAKGCQHGGTYGCRLFISSSSITKSCVCMEEMCNGQNSTTNYSSSGNVIERTHKILFSLSSLHAIVLSCFPANSLDMNCLDKKSSF